MTDFMNKFFSWREFSRQWWGLPVLCALVFINLASWLSPIVMLPEGRTYLIYMPLAVCVALLMVFDWRALPCIVLTMFIRYDLRIGAEMGTLLTLIYLFSLAAAWAGYRWQAGRRWSASFGLMRLPLSRVSWLVVFLSVLFVFVLQIVVELDLLPDYLGMVTRDFMTLRTLINLQAIMLGTLLSGHLWYLVLRVLRKPRYLRVLRAKLRNQRAPGGKAPELALWFMILICMVVMLCLRGISGPVAKILLSDYTLTLLLPVLLFGAMRYGYHFISIVWTVALVVLFNHYRGFISESGFIHNLVFVSALMLVFTLSLLMMSAISSRQRRLMQKPAMPRCWIPSLVCQICVLLIAICRVIRVLCCVLSAFLRWMCSAEITACSYVFSLSSNWRLASGLCFNRAKKSITFPVMTWFCA